MESKFDLIRVESICCFNIIDALISILLKKHYLIILLLLIISGSRRSSASPGLEPEIPVACPESWPPGWTFITDFRDQGSELSHSWLVGRTRPRQWWPVRPGEGIHSINSKVTLILIQKQHLLNQIENSPILIAFHWTKTESRSRYLRSNKVNK